jgi:HAD superfamily hydrolase (TIGR01509 family)
LGQGRQIVPERFRKALKNCDTLMLDMDGTLLDLAFDNYLWMHIVPREFALQNDMPEAEAKEQLYAIMRKLQGSLDWYCLDFWSDHLDLDIATLHRDANHRIGYLPGAEEFLKQVSRMELRLLLVSNSHIKTLDIKNEVTDVKRFFDEIYLSHDLGHPKEDQPFWESLQDKENFDPERTMFMDDNLLVLGSARDYGIGHVVAVARPETAGPARDMKSFRSVDRIADILAIDSD